MKLFPGKKLTSKFFKKLKKPYFGAIWGSFCLYLGKNKFSWKKRIVNFSIFQLYIIMQRSEKNAKSTGTQVVRQREQRFYRSPCRTGIQQSFKRWSYLYTCGTSQYYYWQSFIYTFFWSTIWTMKRNPRLSFETQSCYIKNFFVGVLLVVHWYFVVNCL